MPTMSSTAPLPRDLRAPAPTARPDASTAEFFESRMRLLPGIIIPLRSMLVTAGSDRILISPVGTAAELTAVGDGIAALVAPSLLHHKFLPQAIHHTQPDALWGPPGLTAKKPELAPMRVFGADPWPWTEHLEFEVVDGAPRRNEVVFFHRASRTLYTADLFFNISEPRGVLAPIAFRLLGIHGRFAMAKMWRSWVEDRAAFGASIERILGWDFDRVVLAHGDVVDRDARDTVIAALREQGF